jgi:ergothioneine biosynthesis protein EgtB
MAELIEQRFTNTWSRTDRLFELLAGDQWLARPIALRHPFIFYLGHLPAFAWNHVCAGVLGREAFNPGFDEMFSRGIDPDVDDPEHCHDHPEVPDRWPSVAAVLSYRDRVRDALLAAIGPIGSGEVAHPMARDGRVFSMVIEHELMHQETLLYMLQRLPVEQLRRPEGLPAHVFGSRRAAALDPEPVRIPAGAAVLGAWFEDLTFGWDNEFPATCRLVPEFRIDALPVTNAAFLRFVQDGGYTRRELWDDADWRWRAQAKLSYPIVWQRRSRDWIYRTLFEWLPLEAVGEWPVYVSLAEARAYARWRGGRLPTEAEFHRAAYGDSDGGEHRGPGEPTPWTAEAANFDFRHWAPTPVGAAGSAGVRSVHDLVGGGWEWTATPFAGFPGFEANIPGYPGYSADFFDGKHAVLKGASWATGADLVRPSFRNWFQAHYPYVFAKFRCVVDDPS